MSSFNINTVIDTYNKVIKGTKDCQNIELEAKIHSLDKKDFIAAFGKMIKVESNFQFLEIETTLNYISSYSDQNGIPYSYIKCLTFDGIKKTDVKHYKKSPIGTRFNVNNEFMKYTVAISMEDSCDAEQAQFNALFRFKIRASFVHKDVPGWRYDLTQVSQIKAHELDKEKTLARIQALFSGLEAGKGDSQVLFLDRLSKEFIAKTGLPEISAYEIEVERVSSSSIEEYEIKKALSPLWASFDTKFVDDRRSEVLRQVNELISTRLIQGRITLKNMLNQAYSISRNDYYSSTLYPPIGHLVTDKADGERALLFASDKSVHLITKDLITVGPPKNDETGGDGTSTVYRTYIADCELITLKDGSKTLGIFDVLYVDGIKVLGQDLMDRMSNAPAVVDAVKMALGTLNITVFAKEYLVVNDLMEETFLKVTTKKRPYKTDGLIIATPKGSYFETKNYKWKPTEDNTIDFLVKKCPGNLLGMSPYIPVPGKELYILFVGMSSMKRKALGIEFINGYRNIFPGQAGEKYMTAAYAPVQFMSALDPYAHIYYEDNDSPNKIGDRESPIVEFSYAPGAAESLSVGRKIGHSTAGKNMFSFVRVREDRSIDNGEFGNDYDIAEKIFTSLIDPFTLESLWTPNTGYFEKSRDAIYMASNKYKRFIIKVLFKEYIKSSSIVFDMAAGRGADLPGYYESKVSRLLAMDIDATALVELIRRNIDLQSKMSVNAHGHDSKSSLKLSVLVANAAANPQTTMHVIKDRFSLEEGAADNVVCNYAFHYMCINKSSAENALTFIYDSLKNDGHAIITVMNGQKIFDLLSGLATGESWSITEDSMEKYKIRKDFASDTLGDFGQMISVKLPMATEMYTEPLCNLDVVTQLAESVGLELVTIVNYSDKMGVFAVDNPNIANKLSAGDKLYCGLHAAIIFKKPAEKPKKKVGGFKIRK